MKQIFKKITFLLLLAGFMYTCQKEPDIFPVERFDRELSMARSWYEANYPDTFFIRPGSTVIESSQIPMKPDWEKAYVKSNKREKTVEVELLTRGRMQFVSAENRKKWQETQDERYLWSLTRLVINTKKRTGKKQAFLMSIMPSVEYLEKTNFDPFKKVAYIGRNKTFSGKIMFHNMNGDFVNGWRYENGKIVRAIRNANQDDPVISLMSTGNCYTITDYELRMDCTVYYSGVPGVSLHINVICDPPYWVEVDQYTECGNEGDYDDEYGGEGDEFGGGGGGGTSGGYNNNDSPKTPRKRNDCQPSAAANSTQINNVLQDNSSPYTNLLVSPQISTLRAYAQSQSTEHALVINYEQGVYYTNSQGITSGTMNSVNPETGVYAYMIVHTHPAGTNSAPSPADATALMHSYRGTVNLNDGSQNITANVVFAANGSEYIVYINDRNAFVSFCDNPSNGTFIYSNNGMFATGSTWDNTYNEVRDDLIVNGYSQNDAQSYALSYVLDYYNTGMKIYEKKAGTSTFKEQKTNRSTSQSTTNYSPTICP
ncbi:MAG: hypothetical protein LBL04_17300 [Bacteroidales bacterium]|jgi:hypothetical protein|nr:hypothetical protein [Bacteroidales bacterium]